MVTRIGRFAAQPSASRSGFQILWRYCETKITFMQFAGNGGTTHCPVVPNAEQGVAEMSLRHASYVEDTDTALLHDTLD